MFQFILPTFSVSVGQWMQYGSQNYVSFYHGELPLVLSVPHGGDQTPADIPDRTCNDPVYAQDAYTIETAQAISDACEALTGCRPFVVTCHLHRRKVDCNRNLEDGACNDPSAMLAWNEFHSFISAAQQEAAALYDGRIFFIDLHGHGNIQQRIELGYLLYEEELELSNTTLDAAPYLDYSSIRTLAENNTSNSSHSALLRGPLAMGTLLGNVGFPSVPSAQIPAPGLNSNYFSGGYITANHTCYSPDNATSGLQMELNFSGIRDNAANRLAFAQALVAQLDIYYTSHIRSAGLGCGFSQTVPFYPTPCTRMVVFGNTFLPVDCRMPDGELIIFSATGKRLMQGALKDFRVYPTMDLEAGVFLVQWPDGSRQKFVSIH